ncbi:MAG: hypothetical protein IKE48_01975 [Parasporobacterium sp.]|nr:hypothetical protein [Parasporobacterium sp.]
MEINRSYYIDETNPINGTYECCMKQEFHGGINRRYGRIRLRADGEGRLSGTMFPTMFWLESTFSYGTCDKENFAFTAYFGSPCQQFSMDVKGKVVGDTLTGEVHSPMGDYVLEGKRKENV